MLDLDDWHKTIMEIYQNRPWHLEMLGSFEWLRKRSVDVKLEFGQAPKLFFRTFMLCVQTGCVSRSWYIQNSTLWNSALTNQAYLGIWFHINRSKILCTVSYTSLNRLEVFVKFNIFLLQQVIFIVEIEKYAKHKNKILIEKKKIAIATWVKLGIST